MFKSFLRFSDHFINILLILLKLVFQILKFSCAVILLIPFSNSLWAASKSSTSVSTNVLFSNSYINSLVFHDIRWLSNLISLTFILTVVSCSNRRTSWTINLNGISIDRWINFIVQNTLAFLLILNGHGLLLR